MLRDPAVPGLAGVADLKEVAFALTPEHPFAVITSYSIHYTKLYDDGDSVPDVDDNCPDTSNPDQTDTDLDGLSVLPTLIGAAAAGKTQEWHAFLFV